MPRHSRAARATVTLLLSTTVLTGCGGAPSRSDFVAKSRSTLGDDLYSAMADRGVTRREADALIDDFLTCQYDALRGNVELLEKAYDNPSDISIQADIDTRASTCTGEMQTRLTEIADPAPPTTTTTAALPPTTIVPPEPSTTLAPPASLDSIPTTTAGA